MASVFTGVAVAEIRVYDNPKDPDNSDYQVLLPMTTIDAVTNPNTGETVEEIAAALNTALNAKADSAATTTALGNKVDKVTGKGLSANDYTAEEKAKLGGIEAGAQKNAFATDAEATAGTATNKAVNPKQLKTGLNAKADKAGDTMTGVLVAYNNTKYDIAQTRNITISTTNLTAGSSALASGSLYLVYE
jgi:hypothetical protein